MPLSDKTSIRFFGVAAYEIVNRLGQRILLDPFMTRIPLAPLLLTVSIMSTS